MSHASNNKAITRPGKRKATDGSPNETGMKLGRSKSCTSCRQMKVWPCTLSSHTGIDQTVRIVRMRCSENISSALLEMQDEKFGLSNGLEFQTSANETVSGASSRNERLTALVRILVADYAYTAN